MCWLTVRFSVLSVCPSGVLRSTTCRWSCFRRLLWQLLYLRGIQWRFQQLLQTTRLLVQTSLQPLWPSRFFRQSASPVSSLFLRAENLTTRSPAWLFPQFQRCFFQRCFPPYFQLCLTLVLDSPSLLSLLLFVKRTSPPVPQRGSSPFF